MFKYFDAQADLSVMPQSARIASPTCASVNVRLAGRSDRVLWTNFVARHLAATVFHSWEWRAILCSSFSFQPHYLLAERGTAVVGILPLIEVKTLLFGHTLTSLPFCSWAGPLADDLQVHNALDQRARAITESLGADHLEYRMFGAPERNWPTQDLYVAFRKNIVADHDANMSAIPRKQRAMVRRGIKYGLAGAEDSVDSFYTLYRDNVHRHGTPAAPRRFFESIQTTFGDRCQILTVRSPDGTLLSGVLSLLHGCEVFPFYAGDTLAARSLAANDFTYWDLMRRGADAGFTRMNLGRSKRGTGSYDFKKNWGFQPEPLSYQFYLRNGDSIPQKNPLNPKYRLLINTWRRLPRWLVNRAGPLLIRGLG